VTLLNTVVAIATLWCTGEPVRQAQVPVEVVAKRFLRGEATLIDGFCRVPFGFLTVVPAAGGARDGAYRVEVAVRDSSGLVLHESGWSQTVGAEFLDIPGASTVEHFSFSVPQGRYTLDVSVADSVSGAVQRASVEVMALPTDVRVSDVLLSSGIRRAVAEGAAAGPGEIQKGSLFIATSARPVLTPRQADLFYYVEFYPRADVAVELTAAVTQDGRVITSTAPEQLSVGAAGGVASRSLSLAGLPAGEYGLRLTVAFPDGDVVRDAAFTMAGFETEAQIAVVTAAPPSDPFAELTETRLDSLYGPTVYLQDAGERNVYDGLSVDGKRNYMRQFWEKRDPTPGTPGNEAMVAYYRLFAEANRRFRESGAAGTPGWRTDRGRIFLKYGVPEATLRQPVSGDSPPYEVWKFSRPRQLKYVFLDETGLGNYQLIYTTDRFETSRADWMERLGARAVDEVLRF
jgi:GWxTD domain-containing protein